MNKSGSLCPSPQGLASYLGRTLEPPEAYQQTGSSHLDRKESSYLSVHVWSFQGCQSTQYVSPLPHFLWLFCFSRMVAGNNVGALLFPRDICRPFPAFLSGGIRLVCNGRNVEVKQNIGAVAVRKTHLLFSCCFPPLYPLCHVLPNPLITHDFP